MTGTLMPYHVLSIVREIVVQTMGSTMNAQAGVVRPLLGLSLSLAAKPNHRCSGFGLLKVTSSEGVPTVSYMLYGFRVPLG